MPTLPNQHTEQEKRLPPIERLLSRLEGVKQCGKGWRGDCPNGHKSKGTLSLATGDDGRVIMHCFAGCLTLDIVHALGLELADLFERLPEKDRPRTPAERREQREVIRHIAIKRAIPELAFEARVVLGAAAILGRGERLPPVDENRLVTAVKRIEAIREVLR